MKRFPGDLPNDEMRGHVCQLAKVKGDENNVRNHYILQQNRTSAEDYATSDSSASFNVENVHNCF